MKTTKFENVCRIIFCAVFVCILLALILLTAYKSFFNYQGYSYFENRNLNPFPELTMKSLVDGYFFSAFENWSRDHVFGRGTVLKLHTLLNMDILKRPVVNETVMSEEVYLPYLKPEKVDGEKISEKAEVIASNLKSHVTLAEELGAKFYYVAVPCQYVCYEDAYPYYLNSRKEFTAISSKKLFEALEKSEVPYIDMRARFAQLGSLPQYSSVVDNHYGINGGYETYRAIMEKYNDDTGRNLDVLDGDEYTVTELPNNYIGSRTRKLLGLRKTDEKLKIITPKNDVPFTRYDNGSEQPSALSVYSMPANEYEDVSYGLYMGGDIGLTRIETERPEMPTMLIYGDSFTNAVESIIWYNFNTTYSIDFRHYKDMSLEDFMREIKPDIVVCIRDYEAILAPQDNGQ